ncbi:VIT1/CCC1 transporter family protein [Franconibacter pulveris 1160]|uniref:Membrane protein n=2 Tax=Franconibacter TaxID=1649295 RepID=A0A0J8YBK0_9ENTR|nr:MULTISPECIES: VIT family protein [Franconibacter]KMV34874.1 membrane protein [Franconibacter pulveris]MCK1967941.1 VIT family protein [Franconibacter sp. IITDAS19]MEB5920588.1 VIT family protein [Franconibacter daqui]
MVKNHKMSRSGWLRAAVLGANDGIVSTASLLTGVASADSTPRNVLLAGIAGMIAGAMSMAVGEYVSVSSQSDIERAALVEERDELKADFKLETDELTAIYVRRGLSPLLARQVAEQLMAYDALAAHARDELGITEFSSARPLQAAVYSAASFAAGALLPLAVAVITPFHYAVTAVVAATLLALGMLGGAAAATGGAPVMRGILRVTLGGIAAMGISGFTGSVFGLVAG